MVFSDFEYSRPDLDSLLQIMDLCCSQFVSATEPSVQINAYRTWNDAMNRFDTMKAICRIRHTCNTKDLFYAGEQAFFDKVAGPIGQRTLNIQQAILTSPFRKELEAEFSPIAIKNQELAVQGFSDSEAYLSLIQEENQLKSACQSLYASGTVEYDGRTLTLNQLVAVQQSPFPSVRRKAFELEGQWFDSHQEEFDSLFDRLVKNRTEQARLLGFENYVPVGYIRQRRNCYTAKDVEKFHNNVINELVPLSLQVKSMQANRIGQKHLHYWDDAYYFPDGNPQPQGSPEKLLAYAQKMYQQMSPETAEFIDIMYSSKLFDVLSRPGKAPGGYCTGIPDYHVPFIYANFNGTSHDVEVLTHEAGHAFAYYRGDKRIRYRNLVRNSMEVAETHSMGMEYLTAPWHHLFFKDQTDKYERLHLEKALSFIPYGTLVDHFQQLVYENPDWTPSQRNQAWLDLDSQYRPWLDYGDLPFYSRGAGWQRQLHIYLYPFYYLEYALAQATALQFWALAQNDRDESWKKYLQFVDTSGTMTYKELVYSVGLKYPMDEGSLLATCKPVLEWLAAST